MASCIDSIDLRKQNILRLALEYETIKEFRRDRPNDYGYAHKKGFAVEAFRHMRRIRVTQDQYSGGRHCTRCKRHYPIERFLRVSKAATRRRSVCLDCHAAESREWRGKNKDRAREIVKQCAKRNPHIAREMKRRARHRSPEAFAARDLLKRALRATGRTKNSRTIDALGYSPHELRAHIEEQFAPGMSWENWGEWHIDHIKPVCVFVAECETGPSQINALKNLRPLWAEDNIARARGKWRENGEDRNTP